MRGHSNIFQQPVLWHDERKRHQHVTIFDTILPRIPIAQHKREQRFRRRHHASLDGLVGWHNAYLHGATNIDYTNNHDIWTNITWQPGPLGSYYQPTNSPLLNNGSTNASNLGLFHYAVTTNSTVEGSNVVSRGYHYVVVSTNGLPLDSNNDGVPDYLEDANGDGTNNDAESWNSSTSPWIGTQPFNQYAALGASATFSVIAYGTAPLSYQWMTNGAAITSATASSYNIPSAPSSDAWTYTVKVSNSSGNVTSSGVTLTVVIAPQVSNISPTTNATYWLQTNFEALFLVVTNPYYGSATPPYYSQYLDPYLYYMAEYQWQYDWTNIPFASGNGANVTYIPAFEGGFNTFEVSNPAGTTDVSWTNIFFASPGMLEAWGENLHGECNRPVWLTNAVGIAAGEGQCIAVTDTGSVVQWGDYGDKGGGNVFSVSNYLIASPPPTSGVVAVAAGEGQDTDDEMELFTLGG